jgi:co-chaperonin GroES (HSP10)
MYFYPRNKYLHVEVPEEKSDENTTTTGLFLPADYKRKDSPLTVVKLLKAAKSSDYVQDEGSFLLVATHSIETIEFDGLKISVVPEHVIYGTVVRV